MKCFMCFRITLQANNYFIFNIRVIFFLFVYYDITVQMNYVKTKTSPRQCWITNLNIQSLVKIHEPSLNIMNYWKKIQYKLLHYIYGPI